MNAMKDQHAATKLANLERKLTNIDGNKERNKKI